MTRDVVLRTGVLFLLCAARAQAQGERPIDPAERLGRVHLVTTCAPVVAPEFDRAVALLHSFEFGASIRAFNAILAVDSTCAMAHWGIALSRWTNPMSSVNRTPAQLELGRIAASNAMRLSLATTDRERGYAAAVNELFADYGHRDQRARIDAYEEAMARLAASQPADTEAQIFHALALVASALPTDKTYAKQLKAGAILEQIWASQPTHPGLPHYIIHSYDVPALAQRARIAAERYAGIAPSAAHALHMPSHTFTRIGEWQESIATNLRSIAAASPEGNIGEMLHASDYMEYAYLQLGRDAEAKAVLDALPALASRFATSTVVGAAPRSAGVFALAAIPARYALEREAWAEAARLVPASTAFPYADALSHFARALGAARLGDVLTARASADSLGALHARLVNDDERYWAEQVAIQELGARAWIALASGRRDDAVSRMRDAAAREDATEKGAITPGPLAPARELLGDMLMEVGQPGGALAEYRQTLTREPNRFRSLAGARRAAAALGDVRAAAHYAEQLRALGRPLLR